MSPRAKSKKPGKPSASKRKPKASAKATKSKPKSTSKLKKWSRSRSVSKKRVRPATVGAPRKSVGIAAASKSTITESTLQVGAPAPPFALPDETGKVVNLCDFQGQKVVLYFYPKDDTPGCTKEACDFRDGIREIREKGAVVLGVSADSVASHRMFWEKFQLNFPLLSDETKSTLQAYGVWKEKSLYGRKFMGIERTTVLIKEDGTIAKIFPKVKVDGHYSEILQALG